ncbi:MAG: hypothetical protein J7L78_02740, partial [Dehalococcoidales bacterium]|nr:hypothetical protein [Dehalococcoidales bacterium]
YTGEYSIYTKQRYCCGGNSPWARRSIPSIPVDNLAFEARFYPVDWPDEDTNFIFFNSTNNVRIGLYADIWRESEGGGCGSTGVFRYIGDTVYCSEDYHIPDNLDQWYHLVWTYDNNSGLGNGFLFNETGDCVWDEYNMTRTPQNGSIDLFEIITGNWCHYPGHYAEIYWDNIFIRKYVATEPNWDSFESEQNHSSESEKQYGSPLKMQENNQWQWANFTWQNASILNGTVVGWRIYFMDTSGNVNHTQIMSFYVGDFVSPEITNITDVPDPQMPGASVNISCDVIDNIAVDEVWVNVTYPDNTSSSFTMTCMHNSSKYYFNKTYSIPGVYSYFIWANDTSNNVNVSAVYQFEILSIYNLSFYNGWNLITVPVENSWWASSLAENISGCEMISRFDALNQTFRTFIVGGPHGFDFPIVDGFGYFVLVNQSSNFSVSGSRISNVSVPLYVGWNMIGWYHSYNTTASSLAENITNCSMVSRFDALNQTYRTFIVGGPPGFDFTVTPGMGVFVLVDVESVWHGEG